MINWLYQLFSAVFRFYKNHMICLLFVILNIQIALRE